MGNVSSSLMAETSGDLMGIFGMHRCAEVVVATKDYGVLGWLVPSILTKQLSQERGDGGN